jgi:pimeloyl-ACP methyl ester carboxylesterase
VPMITTDVAELEYLDDGPSGSDCIVLVHGFPDDARTWDGVVARLPGDVRVVRPFLRGCGRSRVRADDARGGQVAALGSDVLDLLDALSIERCVLVGHDWGSRAVHAAATLAPDRVLELVAMSTAYGPLRHLSPADRLGDAAAAWYRYWLCTAVGRDQFRADPTALIRRAWAEWSPGLPVTDAAMNRLLASLANDEFVEDVIHYYRHGIGEAPGAPRYAAAQARIDDFPPISVPTTFILGLDDGCEIAASSRGNQAMYADRYDRVELPGVGHFISQEAPDVVAQVVTEALERVRSANV